MKKKQHESGQILIGGLFLLLFAALASFYFVTVSNTVYKLYTNTLKSRFETIQDATKYANILNQIAINNQLIVTEVISAQIAYISAIESGLTLSNHQPYWETYGNFQNKNNLSSLSERSFNSLNKSFSSYSLASGRGFYVAKALAVQNDHLIQDLPQNIKRYLSRSTNAQVHCLALEIQSEDLTASHYVSVLPEFHHLGVTKQNCTLQDKNPSFLTKITNSLPMLMSIDDDRIIEFEKIDEYIQFEDGFSYGISYVKSELSHEFINELKFDSKNVLNTTIHISHPNFFCLNHHSVHGDFVLEQDWKKNCFISNDKFLKAFFKPNWAALVTQQDAGIQTK